MCVCACVCTYACVYTPVRVTRTCLTRGVWGCLGYTAVPASEASEGGAVAATPTDGNAIVTEERIQYGL
jgi:hypothetical protein